MKRPTLHQLAAALLATMAMQSPSADQITTADGALLIGQITKVTAQQIELATTYAGTVTVAMAQIVAFRTDAPITTRLVDGTTVTGVTALDESRTLRVTGDALATQAGIDQLKASWLPEATPPLESGYEPPRRWVYSIGADVVGKTGNSDELATNFVGDLALVSKADELRLYGSYERAEQESIETSDETIAGASYMAFMYDPWGWYVRGEVERDAFEDIDLRTTLAGGLTYRAINTEARTLRLWTGFGYRYESFEDGVDEGVATLDTGLSHRWLYKPWLTLTNDLTYAPAVDDFGDYLFVHDSSLEMPVGASRWVLRLGVRNDYKSEPAPDRDELDTAYYSRLLLRFE